MNKYRWKTSMYWCLMKKCLLKQPINGDESGKIILSIKIRSGA